MQPTGVTATEISIAGQSLVFNGTNYVPQSPNTFWLDTSNTAKAISNIGTEAYFEIVKTA